MTVFNRERACRQQQDALDALDQLWEGNASIAVGAVYWNGKVRSLEIRNVSSSTLPQKFAVLFPKIENLWVIDCPNLADLSNLCKMKALKLLLLKGLTSLRVLPNDITQATSANDLVICHFKDFDYTSHLTSLHNVESKRTHHCEIDRFPSELFVTSKLKSYCLICNDWTRIPNDVGNFQHLNKLIIDGKGIESISPAIGRLGLLKTLKIACKRVKTLPTEIGLLVRLEELDLCGCRALTRIQASVFKLPRLKKLDLTCCHKLSVPEKDILECSDALTDFRNWGEVLDPETALISELFHYMTRMNRAGRSLLKHKDVKLALWGPLLERCRMDADALFFFLKRKHAELVPSHTTSTDLLPLTFE